MMKFRGYFHPDYSPEITGLNKAAGSFWIGFLDDEDLADGLIRIELTVSSGEEDPIFSRAFADIHVHYDGLKVLRHLEEVGFLKIFEETRASTFYDVVQCCARCKIPIIYHGDHGNELVSRQLYDLLHTK